jgi:hypothetical protein
MKSLESHLNDHAAKPTGFGFFEDFLVGNMVDSTGVVTGAKTVANIATPTAAETEQAASSLVTAIIGGLLGWNPITSGTIALREDVGGWVRISGAATTDDSGGQVQSRAGFNFTTGKTASFKAAVKLSNATESDLWMGFFATDATLIAGTNDYVGFQKNDDATTIDCVYRDAGGTEVSYTVPAGTFTCDTSVHQYGVSVTPRGTNNADSTIEWSIDGVVVHRVNGGEVSLASVLMAATLAFQSGTATGTITCDVDYIGAHQQR